MFPCSSASTLSNKPIQRVADSSQSREQNPARKKTGCAHYESASRAYDPQMFIRYPYRPSIMQLLRRVRLTPRDPIVRLEKRVLPNVYASFQMHWDRWNTTSVLTIVAGCDTAVHSPVFNRHLFKYGILTVEATRESERQFMQFEVPLALYSDFASCPAVLDYYKGFTHVDRLNSYIIHPNDLNRPYVIVNLWNLSHKSCINLHRKAVILIDTPDVRSEHYVFGMTGVRDTTFKIQFPALDSRELYFLDERDLVHIGYYYKWDRKPRYSIQRKQKPQHLPITKMFPVDSHKFSKKVLTVLPAKHVIDINEVYAPFSYPLRQTPDVVVIGTGDPEAFPPGYYLERECLDRTVVSVQDAVNRCGDFHPRPVNLIETFSTYYNVTKALIQANLTTDFAAFLTQCHISKNNFLRTVPKYYTESRLTWMEPTMHPVFQKTFVSVVDTLVPSLLDTPCNNNEHSDDSDSEIDMDESTQVTETVTVQVQDPSIKTDTFLIPASPADANLQSENAATLCEQTGFLYWRLEDFE